MVLRSTNDGRSWRPIDLTGPGGGGPRTLWAGGGRAAVLALEAIRPLGRGTGIVRISDDAGAAWRAVTVPDPNGTGRWIGHGIWWKDRWIFYGAAERPDGSGWPSYSAVWQSTDGRHLDFTPGLLPGGPEHLTADRLTVIDDTLLGASDVRVPAVRESLLSSERFEQSLSAP